MAYHVKIDALDTMVGSLSTAVSDWGERLGKADTGRQALIDTSNMSGAGADNIRSYLETVHGAIVAVIYNVLVLHQNNFRIYRSDYLTLDNGLGMSIKQTELEDIREKLEGYRLQAVDVQGEVEEALWKIRDLFTVSYQDVTYVDMAFSKLVTMIDTLNEDVKALESRHVSTSFVETSQAITALNAMIQEMLGQGRSYKSDFTPASLAGSEAFQDLYAAYVSVSEKAQAQAETMETVIENENQHIEALQAEAERLEAERKEREKKAAIIKGVVFIACVAVTTVCTGGLGTAVVVGACVGAATAATNTLTDHYVEHGNLKNLDLGELGKNVFIGAATGAVSGAIGYGIGKGAEAVTKGVKVINGAVNSSSTVVRIGSNAAVGAVKDVVSGGATRFATTMITSGGDLKESTSAAMDGSEVIKDAVGGAIGGGMDGARKNPDAPKANIDNETTSETVERVAKDAGFGAVKEVTSGAGGRFAGTLAETGDVGEAAKEAFNGEEIIKDAAKGGIEGGYESYKDSVDEAENVRKQKEAEEAAKQNNPDDGGDDAPKGKEPTEKTAEKEPEKPAAEEKKPSVEKSPDTEKTPDVGKTPDIPPAETDVYDTPDVGPTPDIPPAETDVYDTPDVGPDVDDPYADVDWENTSNTPEELEILRQEEAAIRQKMAEGEDVGDLEEYLPVETTTDFEEPDVVTYYRPTGKHGTIIGDRDSGDFEYIPDDPDVQAIMKKYGQSSIQYNDNEPDFSPYAKHKTEQWGTIEAEVEIGEMSGDRTAADGNYAQADEQLAQAISNQTGKTVTAEEVKAYRKKNKLTWHETQDGYTMQLIPTKINSSASHTGGTAIKQNEQEWGDISHDYGD